MLIIWRGFGWLIPAIVFVTCLFSQLVFEAIFGKGFYGESQWPKVAAFAISSLLIAYLGYFLNHKNRQVFIDTKSAKLKKSPAHSLFFIPIELWAVIIPVLFIWFQINQAETDKQERIFIESPVVNDIYGVNFTEIFTNFDSDYKYGVLKVVDVKPDGVFVLASHVAYNKEAGVKKDIKKGKITAQRYYSGAPFFISKARVEKLKNKSAIFQVTRRSM